MNILLIYATYSSSTKVAADVIEGVLTESGHTVTVIEAADSAPDDYVKYDLVVMGSPSWYNSEMQGMPHEDFIKLKKQTDGKIFEGRKFAVFGLGDKTYSHFCGAVDFLEQYISEMQGTLVGDSIRIDSFFENEEEKHRLLRDWIRNLVTNVNSV